MEYEFTTCPECKTTLRVPGDKGLIRVTCPKCQHVFEHQGTIEPGSTGGETKKKGFFSQLFGGMKKAADSAPKKAPAEEAAPKQEHRKSEPHPDTEEIGDNPGAKAVCAYFLDLFQEDHAGYEWLKENPNYPLYPNVREDGVSLYYKNKQGVDAMIGHFPFAVINKWNGLQEGKGYTEITDIAQRKQLEALITRRVDALDHIKLSDGGFAIKRFGF